MKNGLRNADLMHDVWNRYSDIITVNNLESDNIWFDELMASVFSPGHYYYYIVDFYDRQIKRISNGVENILGLSPASVTFDDIIARIHPDDIGYVVNAESAIIDHLYNKIGNDKVTRYKTSYCFRIRTADGSYRMFQHQAIILSTDERGGFARVLNIHTDIDHFTKENNHTATITDVLGEESSVQLKVHPNAQLTGARALFSARETEVIRLIADGLTNAEMAAQLTLSHHTIKNHRKNIIKKAGVKSSSELIAQCIKDGLIWSAAYSFMF